MNILEGYRVVDCTLAMAGPFAAQRLGDLGADVIKVEPVEGEWTRHVAHPAARGQRVNASVLSLNRNKRSIAVNLKSDEGREIVWALTRSADVFLQGFRPGVAERLQIDYERLRDLNPKLVYVSISGYGSSGPLREAPGQDILLQAMSGLMFSTGRKEDAPQVAGLYVVDAVTGYTAFEGALAALLYRERTGEGQLVEVNMLDSIVCLQMQELTLYLVGHLPQERGSEPHGHVYVPAPYGVFKTADGYLALAFPAIDVLAELLGSAELKSMAQDARYTHHDEIHRAVQAGLVMRSTKEWLEVFGERGAWVGPVLTYEELCNAAQVLHNGSLISYEHHTEGQVTTPGFPIRFSRSPSAVRQGAPLAGQHTVEVLTELGLSRERVDELLRCGVVAEPASEMETD